jgi:hypothetical protein
MLKEMRWYNKDDVEFRLCVQSNIRRLALPKTRSLSFLSQSNPHGLLHEVIGSAT